MPSFIVPVTLVKELSFSVTPSTDNVIQWDLDTLDLFDIVMLFNSVHPKIWAACYCTKEELALLSEEERDCIERLNHTKEYFQSRIEQDGKGAATAIRLLETEHDLAARNPLAAMLFANIAFRFGPSLRDLLLQK